MRLDKRTQNDKMNTINRCFFDAQHSRVSLALVRLEDLKNEFLNDAQIIYAEGLIRKDYLGQGIKAGDLFRTAYEIDNNHAFAACNATLFARNEQEFFKWAELSMKADPNDKSLIQLVTSTKKNMENGIPYGELLLGAAQQHFEAKSFGFSAAFAEIALQTGQIPPDRVANLRRGRAQSLRSLDSEAHHYRETIMEDFPPEERLALHEALEELDRSISLDEYDAELWNLKSAWSIIIGKYEDAVRYADKAINLRPFHYPKPYHNKAAALWKLNRREEALNCAHESLKHAESIKSVADIKMSNNMIKDFSTKRKIPSLSDLEPMIKHILNAAYISSDQEIGQMHNELGFSTRKAFKKLVNGVARRGISLGANWNQGYIQIITELLSDLTPETVFKIVLHVSDRSQEIHSYLLHAALYVACHSRGSMQRDASRFLVLTIFGAIEGPAIQKAYREAILIPSATATDNFSHLDSIMREELKRINPLLPKLIADQKSINQEGQNRAERNILSIFTDFSKKRSKPLSGKAMFESLKYGSAFAVAGLFSAFSSIYGSAGTLLIIFMAFVVFIPPYLTSTFRGTTEKNAYLKVSLKLLALYVWSAFTLPSIANYLSAWGIIWGMSAVFMINLISRRLYLCQDIRKWIISFLLCWLYAYISDKGLRSLWGPSPYDLETVFYGMHFFYGGLSALTILLIFYLRVNLMKGFIFFLVSSIGFFLGDIASVFFIKFILSFNLDSINPYHVPVYSSQILSGLCGGMLTGVAVSRIRPKEW
jgi:tetratricopeptide (TPR) repeat protein